MVTPESSQLPGGDRVIVRNRVEGNSLAQHRVGMVTAPPPPSGGTRPPQHFGTACTRAAQPPGPLALHEGNTCTVDGTGPGDAPVCGAYRLRLSNCGVQQSPTSASVVR